VGGVDPPGAVPVDEPVPLVVPGTELPVVVLDDEVVWGGVVVLVGVVEVESPGV
jgi:hypothetical protein